MTHRLATNYAKNYCNRTLIVKVIVENVVTCFLGHSVFRLWKIVVTYIRSPCSRSRPNVRRPLAFRPNTNSFGL